MAVLSISEIKDNYYDFIVVGSGPACFSFISNLNSNFKVLVIEGGFKDFNSISQSSYEGQVDPLGFRHAPLDQFRIRQLGGSSNCWGGACVPFDPYDFELTENNKPLWPISYKSLIPHYIKAGSLYGIGNYFSIKKPPVVFNRSIPGLRQSFWLVNDSKKNFTDRVLQLALNSSKIDLCLESNLVDVILLQIIEYLLLLFLVITLNHLLYLVIDLFYVLVALKVLVFYSIGIVNIIFSKIESTLDILLSSR